MQHPDANSYLISSSLQCDCITDQFMLVCSHVLILSFSISDISFFPVFFLPTLVSAQSAFTTHELGPLGPFCPWRFRSYNHKFTLYPFGTDDVPDSLFIPPQVALSGLCEIFLNFQASKNLSCQILEIQQVTAQSSCLPHKLIALAALLVKDSLFPRLY